MTVKIEVRVGKGPMWKVFAHNIESGTPEQMGQQAAEAVHGFYQQMKKLSKAEGGSVAQLEFILGVSEKLHIATGNGGPLLEACPNEYCSVSRWKTKEVGIPCHVCGATNPGDVVRNK